MESFGRADDVLAVRAFREAAIGDGWDHSSTYNSEPEESACTLRKDGYVVSTISRDARADLRGHTLKANASIYAWGPDGLALTLETWAYPGADWFASAVRRCNLCGSEGETFRYSFAGRACKACLPKAKAEHEKPGWDN